MPRPPRIHAPGLLYHVICRGNQGQKIFEDEQDYRAYLHRLEETNLIAHFRLYAYALMGNHIHLLVEVSDRPLSKIMQTLQQRYAQHFNKKYNKLGHLFQGRFKALICERDAYLLELVRYIHLNPVRAGIVRDPADYPWTSHRAYLAKKADAWLDRDAIIMQFGKSIEGAKKHYLDFVLAGIPQGHRDDLYEVKEQQVLGSDEFVETLPIGSSEGSRITLQPIDKIEKIISSAMLLKTDEIIHSRSGMANIARGLIGIIASDMGIPLKDVAGRLKRAPSSLSHSIKKTRKLLLNGDKRVTPFKNEIESKTGVRLAKLQV